MSSKHVLDADTLDAGTAIVCFLLVSAHATSVGAEIKKAQAERKLASGMSMGKKGGYDEDFTESMQYNTSIDVGHDSDEDVDDKPRRVRCVLSLLAPPPVAAAYQRVCTCACAVVCIWCGCRCVCVVVVGAARARS